MSRSRQDCPFIVCMTYAFHTPDKLCFILDLMNGKATCAPPAQINLYSQSVILRNKDWIGQLVADWLAGAFRTESSLDGIFSSRVTLQDHSISSFPLLVSLTIIPPLGLATAGA